MSQARPHNAGSHTVSKWVDASLQAARGGELEQAFLLSDLPRVSEYAVDAQSAATLLARFSKVEQRVMVEGSVEAELQLTCQRCLQPVRVDVSDDFSLVIIPSESELSTLAESQEAIVSDPTRLDLAWLTEEQLLLAAPLVPVHETIEQCGLPGDSADEPVALRSGQPQLDKVAAESGQLSSQQPFAALRDLMKRELKK